MAVPRTKKKKHNGVDNKTFYQVRTELAKFLFPDYMGMVLEGTMYELDKILKEFNLEMDMEDRKAFIDNINERITNYCNWRSNGGLNPHEVRVNFEKTYGVDLSEIYIG